MGTTFSKRALIAASLLFSVSGASLLAQGDRGGVSGHVSDVSGARVPNAPVLITEESTHVTLKTKSNGAGEYSFPSLFPGKYTVSVTAPGFQTYVVNQIQIDLGATTQVDLALQIGGHDTTVTVSGTAQLLNYVPAALGSLWKKNPCRTCP